MNELEVTIFKIFPWKCDRRPLRGDPAATCVPAAWVGLLLGSLGGSGVVWGVAVSARLTIIVCLPVQKQGNKKKGKKKRSGGTCIFQLRLAAFGEGIPSLPFNGEGPP